MKKLVISVAVVCASLACASSEPVPEASATGAASVSTKPPTCAEWLGFTPEQQSEVMKSLLVRAVPASVSANAGPCLSGMAADITQQATDRCKRDGGDFTPAASAAINSAIESCQSQY